MIMFTSYSIGNCDLLPEMPTASQPETCTSIFAAADKSYVGLASFLSMQKHSCSERQLFPVCKNGL